MLTNGQETLQGDRRVAPRRQPTFGTICQLSSGAGKTSRTGLVWNLSTSGVSMLMHEPWPAGSELQGQIKTVDERAALPVSFRVAHVRQLQTGDYLVGGPFQRALSADEMNPFLNTPWDAGTPRKR